MPSILVRSLRTEAAQPAQTMFGTARDTRIVSAAGASGVAGVVWATGATTGVGGVVTDTGSDSSAQPTNVAMTPAVISIGTNFFTIILQKELTTQI